MRRQAGTRQGLGDNTEDTLATVADGDGFKEEEEAGNESEPDYEAIEVHAIM
jgi:hypothetical protein